MFVEPQCALIEVDCREIIYFLVFGLREVIFYYSFFCVGEDVAVFVLTIITIYKIQFYNLIISLLLFH